MSDMEFAPETFIDEAQRLSAFISVLKPEPTDIFILVMGMTGSGKSTFINRCTSEITGIGHGLNSCTKFVQVFYFAQDDRRVFLIDTPGFNDTDRSDIETLEILAAYLRASYANNVRIHGLIILHPISHNRMSGRSLRYVEIIKAVYGCSSYNNVAIVTTMWPETHDHAYNEVLGDREAELLTTDKYFGSLIALGATKFRYNQRGTNEFFHGMSLAENIVNHLLNRISMSSPSDLQLQREIIDEGKTVSETTAGISAGGFLYKLRQDYNDGLVGLDEKLNGLLTEADDLHASQQAKERDTINAKLVKAEEEIKALDKIIRDFDEEGKRLFAKRIDDMDGELRAHIDAKEQLLRDSKSYLYRKVASKRQEDTFQREREHDRNHHEPENEWEKPPRRQLQKDGDPRTKSVEELEKMVDDLEKGVAKLRRNYQSFREQKRNVSDGAVNGVATSLTSGFLGAVSAAICTVM